MDKSNLSESDLCDKFIRPAMEKAGWNGLDQIFREYPLRAGRVVVRGNKAYRDKSTVLRADYALFYKANIPLAVVEAKDNKHAQRFKAFGDPPSCGTCHPSSSWKPSAFNHDKRTNFKLTGQHATANCRSCHRGKNPADFERLEGFKWPVAAKDAKCMGCHKHAKVHDGLHKDNECLSCHLKPGTNDGMDRDKLVAAYHGPKSKFPLIKAHRSVACDECHPGGKFKETPIECGARCHEDSLHKGSLTGQSGLTDRRKAPLPLFTTLSWNSTVPALWYLTALASATACSPMALRMLSSMKGEGASSSTF